MIKTLSKIERYILYAIVFLVPIVVLPISPNPYVVGKLAVLVFGLSLAILVRAIRIVVGGKLEISTGNYDFPVILIAIAYIASTFLKTPNKMEALLLPGTTTLIVCAALLYFLLNQLSAKSKQTLRSVILASGTAYTLILVAAAAGILAKIPQLPAFMKAANFTPEGGYLPSAIFLATILPLTMNWGKKTSSSGKELVAKLKNSKAVSLVALIIIAIGLAYSVYNIIPGRPNAPRFLGINTSWFIAVDTLKISPLLGIGPSNYITAFNRFRPMSFNLTDLWAIKFSTANNFYLTALTETGLVGAAGFILLILSVYRFVRKGFAEKKLVSHAQRDNHLAMRGGWSLAGLSARAGSSLLSLALIIILLAIFPATVTTTLILFLFLSLGSKTSKKLSISLSANKEASAGKTGEIKSGIASRVPAIIVAVPLMALVIFVESKAANIVSAEYKFRQGLAALGRNEGVAAYDTIREAIEANPQVDRYHASYSQVNLALANAIAGNPDITDTDRANIAQLIQQAIREAKSTVALNPLRAGNWEILARTYRAIMPLATGADIFSAQTYAQAVALDPYNPNLRVALGGIYYAVGDFNTAVRAFELAVLAKQDLANSHYNLAFAYEKAGQLEKAITEMTLVLSLVDSNSQDYETAKTALENMQEKKAAEAPATENLVPPTEAREPILEPPLDLPEESEPPEAPITPTPTPKPEAESDENVEGETTITPQITPTPAP